MKRNLKLLNRWLFAATFFLALATHTIGQELQEMQEVRLEAFFIPEAIMSGEIAQYIIRFENVESIPDIKQPSVEGLQFHTINLNETTFKTIEGQRSKITDKIWVLKALREGLFKIPSRRVRIGDQDLLIPEAILSVVSKSDEVRIGTLLELDIKDQPFFVGEAIPASLRLLIRSVSNFSKVEIPKPNESCFSIQGLANMPQRSFVRHNGFLYDSFTWDFTITPICVGTYNFGFSQKLGMQVFELASGFPNLLGFGERKIKTYTVESNPYQLIVHPPR